MNMLKKIVSGYTSFFKKVIFFVFLILFCLGVSAIIVFPLFSLAEKAPFIYTTLALSLIGVAIIVFLIKKSYKYLNPKDVSEKEKNLRKKQFLLIILRVLLIAITVFFFIYLVLNGHNLIALAVLVVGFVLNGVLAYGLKPSSRDSLE